MAAIICALPCGPPVRQWGSSSGSVLLHVKGCACKGKDLTCASASANAVIKRSARQSRHILKVRAEIPSTRRNALAAGAAGLLLTLTGSAHAGKTEIPFHASLRGVGSTSGASQSGFDMEGTKKRGISPAQRKKLLAAIKDKALGAS